MYSYELLEEGCYYLVREDKDQPIELIKIGLITDHAVFVQYCNDAWKTAWKLKKDPIADIIECLTDAAVKTWETQFYEGTDAFHENEDDE